METEEQEDIKSVMKQFGKSNSKNSFSLKNLGYLPRWVIIVIDLIVIFVSGLVSLILFKGLGLNYFHVTDEGYYITAYFTINLFFFWWFKTYS